MLKLSNMYKVSSERNVHKISDSVHYVGADVNFMLILKTVYRNFMLPIFILLFNSQSQIHFFDS